MVVALFIPIHYTRSRFHRKFSFPGLNNFVYKSSIYLKNGVVEIGTTIPLEKHESLFRKKVMATEVDVLLKSVPLNYNCIKMFL